MLLPLLPGLLESITKVYQAASANKKTPEELKAHYASIAARLDAVNVLVQGAPEPPIGSGA